MQDMFLKFPFEGKSGTRLNTVWYWRPHFWANKRKGEIYLMRTPGFRHW